MRSVADRTCAAGTSPRSAAWRRPGLEPPLRGAIGGEQQQVDTGAQGRDRVDDLGRALGERAHVHRVGDRDAAEAELAAEQVVHDRAGHGRGQVAVAGDRRAARRART